MRRDGIYIDGTYGRGGHARAILERLGDAGRLVVLDRDPDAVAHAERTLGSDRRVTVGKRSFAELGAVADELHIRERVEGLFLDLGVSSPQLDEAERGFSFRADGPLDMRMDTEQGETAAEWLAQAPESELARVIKEYGEERFARRIARKIVMTRKQIPIRTTAQLAEIVESAVPRKPGKPAAIHPATRTFQAVRIHINQELQALRDALTDAFGILAAGGRIAVISFHSLEDRLVKQAFQRAARPPPADRRRPAREPFVPTLRLIGKLIRPDEQEQQANPRARSARLRVAEKLAAGAER